MGNIWMRDALFFVAFVLLILQELERNWVSTSQETRQIDQYLDESFSALEEVLSTVRFGSFLMPVDNGLPRYTVLVIQYLTQGR
jgi:hypothetical protein